MNGAKSYVSVICEYNPFHYGHDLQLKTLRARFDGVICIMSGNIVQRGSIAVADKYLRAEAAVNSGASLVLELPVPWCCASARDFAAAGVHIADSVGSDFLAFGAEDDFDLLKTIHAFISDEGFGTRVRALVEDNKTLSYPVAFSKIIADSLGKEAENAVSKPNNILALEYMTALKGTTVRPYTVRRDLTLRSSSEIRASGSGEAMLGQLPETSASVFEKSLGKDFPRDGKRLDAFYIGTLRGIKKADKEYYSAPDDLVKKLISESARVSTVDDLVAACTDKIYTSARVRRTINSVVFDVTPDRVRALPPYTCVLAADKTGREILKKAKKSTPLDVITKPARALNASPETRNAFLFSKSVEDVISLSAPIPEPADKGRTPVITDG